MKCTPEEVQAVCNLVNEVSGIQWDSEKSYLIESRFGQLMHERGIATLTDLVKLVRSSATVESDFVDCITTRETLFFRDEGPYNALRHKALPEIIDAKSATAWPQRLRIWSAACSSGQECYSIGIVLHELLDDLRDWDIKILATDLSVAALETARRGIYSDFEMSRGMPDNIRDKYFHKVADGWKISDSVRSLVDFHHRNLLEPFKEQASFDVVFCRNVAIYFDDTVKRDLFSRIADTLAPHGVLFIGSSESLSCMGDPARWKPQFHCRGTFYQPNHHRTYAPPQLTGKSALRAGTAKETTSVHNSRPAHTQLSSRTPSSAITPLATARKPVPSLGKPAQSRPPRPAVTERTILAATTTAIVKSLTRQTSATSTAQKSLNRPAQTTLSTKPSSARPTSSISKKSPSVIDSALSRLAGLSKPQPTTPPPVRTAGALTNSTLQNGRQKSPLPTSSTLPRTGTKSASLSQYAVSPSAQRPVERSTQKPTPVKTIVSSTTRPLPTPPKKS